MSGTVSLSGLVSNTNWTALIDSMINAQKAATSNSLTASQNKYSKKLSAWQSFNTKLTALTDYIDSGHLGEDKGYNVYASRLTSTDSSVSASSVLSASVGSTVSGPGSYSIEVSQLATAWKISSDAHTSKSTDLDLSGDIIVNGAVITIDEDDTLTDVATRINNANAGVTATILQVSDTEYRLTLESSDTGAEEISLRNGGSADLLESLKLHTSTAELANPSGSDALSGAFSDSTTAVGTLLGLSSAQSGTVTINGTDVVIDLSSMSLDDIAGAINTAAPAGVTASVETVTVDGETKYQLQLTNTGASDLTDGNNILETLGVLGYTVSNTIRTGQDAELEIDGYAITSSSNTITTAITGVALTLKGTNVGSPVELAITQNKDQIATNTSTLVTAINNVLDYIKDQNTYVSSDDSTNSGQNPLFADTTLAMVKRNISDAMFSTVPGNSTYTNASSIGITYNDDGTISVDTDVLSDAMTANSGETIAVLKNLSGKLHTSLNGYVDPVSGTLVALTTTLQEKVDGIDTRLEELNARYERQRVVLETKYNALELLISQSETTKSWLTQQTKLLMSSLD